MNHLYKSNATIDTYILSQNNIHNCPTCRCKSTEHSAKLSCNVSQPQLKNNKIQHNLYLSKDISQAASTDRIVIKPYQSTIITSPTKKVLFKYPNAESKKANISFSYTSPPKNRKHQSSDARFNTKKFKQSRFPEINRDENDNIPVNKVVKKGKEASPYYEVYTKQKTPEKHRILKIKKDKSKQRLDLNNSKQSSSQPSQLSLQKSQQIPIQNLILAHQQYALQGPRNTPINALWTNNSEKTQKDMTNEEIHKLMNKDNISASIQYIKEEASSKSIRYGYSSFRPLQPNSQPLQEREPNKKYPTIQSIDAYQVRRYTSNSGTPNIQSQQTSLRFIKQPSKECSDMNINADFEIARSISQQLELNFDYYYPQQESDRSLSGHVQL